MERGARVRNEIQNELCHRGRKGIVGIRQRAGIPALEGRTVVAGARASKSNVRFGNIDTGHRAMRPAPRHRERKAAGAAANIERGTRFRQLENVEQSLRQPLSPAAEKDLIGGTIGRLISWRWRGLHPCPFTFASYPAEYSAWFRRGSNQMTDTRLSIRLDLASGDRIGPGKIALLEAISKTGSISAAARDIGMSYRRAWLLVEEINSALREPAVTAATGGQHGGGAALTPMGERIVDLYRTIEGHALVSASEEFRAISRLVRKGGKARN